MLIDQDAKIPSFTTRSQINSAFTKDFKPSEFKRIEFALKSTFQSVSDIYI